MGKRLSITAAGFLLLLILYGTTVHADNGEIYEVGTDSLNVRSGPSQDSVTIGQLESGDQVTVFQESFGWARTYYNGEKAWVAAHYLIPDEQETASADTVEIATNDNTASVNQTGNELTGYNIVIDPGHGGIDPGAIQNGNVLEKNLTMTAAESVASELREVGADVELTRSDDVFMSLEERVSFSHANETDAFISLHYNAFPIEEVNGFGTYYHSGADDRQLAKSIQTSLGDRMALNSRGTIQNGYHVLRENSDLAVLTELGFMTSPYDMSIIQTEAHQTNVAEGITEGVINYFN